MIRVPTRSTTKPESGWRTPPCSRWREKPAAVAAALQPKAARSSAKKRPMPKTVVATSVAMVKQAPTMYHPKKIGPRPLPADGSAMGVPAFGVGRGSAWWAD